MDEKNFDAMIDSYVENDPREYLKAGRKRTDDDQRTDISADDFTRIAGPVRQRLATRAEAPVKRRDYARIDALLAEYAADLRAAIGFERRAGILKPWNVADTFEPWFRSLDDHGWRAPEKSAIKSMLEQGDEIVAVDFRTVTMKRRTITREDVRQFALDQRPRWQVDLPDSMRPSEFLAWAGFPTDEAIEKLEAMAVHVERQGLIRTSGPRHMVGKEYE
ncbi:hypothetical protein [Candidatus Binatus sp.]|uniref:hypothetical protein n=1 Tax=Candidatus Binatus sp. TaxID=2811406 RepID=UPI003C6A1507